MARLTTRGPPPDPPLPGAAAFSLPDAGLIRPAEVPSADLIRSQRLSPQEFADRLEWEYAVKSQGEPCKQGETSEQTGCVPAEGEAKPGAVEGPDESVALRFDPGLSNYSVDSFRKKHLDAFLKEVRLTDDQMEMYRKKYDEWSASDETARKQLESLSKAKAVPPLTAHPPVEGDDEYTIDEGHHRAAVAAKNGQRIILVWTYPRRSVDKIRDKYKALSALNETSGGALVPPAGQKQQTDATRPRRTADPARQRHYAGHRQRRFSQRLGFGQVQRPVSYGKFIGLLRNKFAGLFRSKFLVPMMRAEEFTMNTKSEGQPCEQGETSTQTGCVPQTGETHGSLGKKPKSQDEWKEEVQKLADKVSYKVDWQKWANGTLQAQISHPVTKRSEGIVKIHPDGSVEANDKAKENFGVGSAGNVREEPPDDPIERMQWERERRQAVERIDDLRDKYG